MLFERRFHRCHESSPITLQCVQIIAKGSLESLENTVAAVQRGRVGLTTKIGTAKKVEERQELA